jgi:antitoxin HicB
MKNPHIGDDFETAFESDELDEMRALAQKEIITQGLRQAMNAQHMSESELARRMKTSRTSVRRVLDPQFVGSKFDLVAHASAILGKQLVLLDQGTLASGGRPLRRGDLPLLKKKGPKPAVARAAKPHKGGGRKTGAAAG